MTATGWRGTDERPRVRARIEVDWAGMTTPARLVEVVAPWGASWVLDMDYLSGAARRTIPIREIKRWRYTAT